MVHRKRPRLAKASILPAKRRISERGCAKREFLKTFGLRRPRGQKEESCRLVQEESRERVLLLRSPHAANGMPSEKASG